MAFKTDDTRFGQIESLLTCSICLETFNDPRTLPCFHSFCESCLEKFVKSQRDKALAASKKIEEFQCPACRSIFRLKSNEEVAEMSCSHFIRNMLDVLFTQRQDTEGPSEGHVKFKGKSNCKKHKNKTLKFYCETCKELVCRYCMDFNHVKQNHLCLLADDVANDKRQALKTSCEVLEEKMKEGSEALQAVSNVTQRLQEDFNKEKNKVNQHKQEILQRFTVVLNEKAKDMVDELELKYNEEYASLESQTTEVTSYLEKLKISNNLSKSLLESGNEEDIISLQEMITEQVEKLKLESAQLIKPVHNSRIQYKRNPIKNKSFRKIFGGKLGKLEGWNEFAVDVEGAEDEPEENPDEFYRQMCMEQYGYYYAPSATADNAGPGQSEDDYDEAYANFLTETNRTKVFLENIRRIQYRRNIKGKHVGYVSSNNKETNLNGSESEKNKSNVKMSIGRGRGKRDYKPMRKPGEIVVQQDEEKPAVADVLKNDQTAVGTNENERKQEQDVSSNSKETNLNGTESEKYKSDNVLIRALNNPVFVPMSAQKSGAVRSQLSSLSSSASAIHAPEFVPGKPFVRYEETPAGRREIIETFVANKIKQVRDDPGLLEEIAAMIVNYLFIFIKVEDELKLLSDLLFEKCVSLQNFQYIGSRLANHMDKHLSVPGLQVQFRSVFLERCKLANDNFSAIIQTVPEKALNFAIFLGELLMNYKVISGERITKFREVVSNIIKTLLLSTDRKLLICAGKLLKLTGSALGDNQEDLFEMAKLMASDPNVDRTAQILFSRVCELKTTNWGLDEPTLSSQLPPTEPSLPTNSMYFLNMNNCLEEQNVDLPVHTEEGWNEFAVDVEGAEDEYEEDPAELYRQMCMEQYGYYQ